MYSADIRNSSSVADMPRFSSTGFLRASRALQQREVLHVARADLDGVGVALDEVDALGVDGLGDHGQAGLLARLGQDLQALLARGPGRSRGWCAA